MIKDLTINGTVYAKYQILDKVLYLKPVKNIGKLNNQKSVTLTIFLIQQIEPEKIKAVGYLNV